MRREQAGASAARDDRQSLREMFCASQQTSAFMGHPRLGELVVLDPWMITLKKNLSFKNVIPGRPVSRNLGSNRDTISKSPRQRGVRLSRPTSVKIVMLYSAVK